MCSPRNPSNCLQKVQPTFLSCTNHLENSSSVLALGFSTPPEKTALPQLNPYSDDSPMSFSCRSFPPSKTSCPKDKVSGEISDFGCFVGCRSYGGSNPFDISDSSDIFNLSGALPTSEANLGAACLIHHQGLCQGQLCPGTIAWHWDLTHKSCHCG